MSISPAAGTSATAGTSGMAGGPTATAEGAWAAGATLAGRTALVTGASRGIGAATAVALDRAGARVALAARDGERLHAVAAGLSHDPVVLPIDLAEVDAPQRLAAAAVAALGGGVDVLVNNAAFAQRRPITEHDAELIDRMHAINVRAPLLLIGALVPTMIARGGGCIIGLSSISGLVGTPMRSGYGATKGAIDAASRCLARELGGHGIRVNTVAPGVVDTDLWARNKRIAGVIEQVNGQTPLGRWATPADIADVIVFLASDGARFITGQTLSPDGGMSTTLDLYSGNV